MRRIFIALLLLVMLLGGCAPSSSPAQSAVGEPVRTGPKRVTAAMLSDGAALWVGTPALTLLELFSAGLIAFDATGEPTAQLGEAVPSLSNGLWTLLPDGRMETTYRIRAGARWHDGVPLSTDDLVFGVAVGREFPLSSNFGSSAYANIDSVDAVDDRTVVVSWKRSYIQADQVFSEVFALPMPSHLLEAPFAQYRASEDKASFLNLRYWTSEFVGNGPFMVTEFVPGTHTLLKAFDGYILGRPHLDEIEVRYFASANTLMANLLAGEIDVTIGMRLSVDQALTVKESWPDGTVIYSPYYPSEAVAFPQFVNPDPPVLANVQFRRALAHATDRATLVQSIVAGVGDVARALPAPTRADFAALEPSITDYAYDPRRAAQLIEGLGFTMGPDGIYRDAANQPLTIGTWTAAGDDVFERTMLAVADGWRRMGVGTVPRVVSVAESRDPSVIPSRPGFWFSPLRTDLDTRFLSTEAPLPENNFRGANIPRYMNAGLDGLITRYFVTVPRPERVGILADFVRITTDQIVFIPLFFNARPQMVSNRLQNVQPPTTWASIPNAHLWDLN